MKYKFLVHKKGFKGSEIFDFGVNRDLESESIDDLIEKIGGDKDSYKYNPVKKKIIYATPTFMGRHFEYEIELVEIPELIPEPKVGTNVFGLQVEV